MLPAYYKQEYVSIEINYVITVISIADEVYYHKFGESKRKGFGKINKLQSEE